MSSRWPGAHGDLPDSAGPSVYICGDGAVSNLYAADNYNDAMRYLITTLSPIEADRVCAALCDAGVTSFTATTVRDYRSENCHAEFYRGATYTVNYLERTKLEIAAAEHLVDEIVELIGQIDPASCIYALEGEIAAPAFTSAAALRRIDPHAGGEIRMSQAAGFR
jgi:nitrogen regulatory protein PII